MSFRIVLVRPHTDAGNQVEEEAAALLLLPHVTLQRSPGIPNPVGNALVEGKWEV